jgi:hypothetical protein
MIDTIRQAWSWIGLIPAEIVESNSFGNLIVRAVDGTIWRICPEELSCKVIAEDFCKFTELRANEDFQLDWQMTRFVELAERKLGPPGGGKCYCLKLPAVLGGTYDEANFGTIAVKELISFAGDIAEQIKDVPDGGQIQIEIINIPGRR